MAVPLTRCPRCGPTETRIEVLPTGGPHHAKLLCAKCGAYIKFLPKPREGDGTPSSPETLARVHSRLKPALLRGTEKQKLAARSIRETMLHRARLKRDDALIDLLYCVTDATWFMANRSASRDMIRWPAPKQLENPTPTGACESCGGPAYDDAHVCCDECRDAYTAQRLSETAPAARREWWE